jgi:Holliday junction resolvase
VAQTPEAKVKKQIDAVLKAAGVYYFTPTTGGFGRSGVPDRVACVNGYFLGIEAKAKGGKTTALQERELKAIYDSGGVALVITETNLDLLRGTLKLLMEPA